MLKPTQDKEAYWTPEEIEAKLENEWDGLDEPSLVSFVQDDLLIKLEKLGYHKGLPPSIGEALNFLVFTDHGNRNGEYVSPRTIMENKEGEKDETLVFNSGLVQQR